MNGTARPSPSVVIIGGGASGALLAAQLLRDPDPGLRVTLVERRGEFGRGLAYSTPHAGHRLNVPAHGMSAFAGEPDHFWRWLQDRHPGAHESSWVFVPRRLYGDYLEDILRAAAANVPGRLSLLREEAVALRETAESVETLLAGGGRLVSQVAALAVGHETRPARGRGIAVHVGSDEDTPLPPDAPVMILGSGLSMVDAWISLAEAGHRGQVTVISRHGLVPEAHRDVAPLDIDAAAVPFGAGLTRLTGWLRELVRRTQARGGDWRSVVDGLRPHNQALWQSWPPAQKRRFLRHVRPWWSVHRHRLPADLHARLKEAMANGRLRLVAAEFVDVERSGAGVTATIRPRGARRRERIDVVRLYDCGGVSLDVETSANPLLRHLVRSGAARPDPMRIGLDVDEHCRLVGADGAPSARLRAVGPLTRGRYFEIEAIPDIRVQCEMIARSILDGPDAA